MEMTNNENKNVLKGQQILAQGNALGLRTGEKIVREIALIKGQFLFRTKKMTSIFLEMIRHKSVRKEFFSLIIMFPRTVFVVFPLPRAAFRFVPAETLPWAELYWPFRP
jgi:hypothetical protein